ncbi:carbohydrate-binding module family 43 protein/Glycoside hydrolase family 72 protein [Mycena rosella]|uniref:1,3-beta-glucanosyltransferase n=1 Tax=Mycena rosella TaxID=1033263 RepID=A0AAD7GGE9_MYCRO|nr:carbohydrate-binding module family 43 protein/Glycoside hydrolase family 72 protein [Mycena rosella]
MIPVYVTTAFLALATTAGAISRVTRTGRYLYTDDGTRFFIKGVAYQPEGLVVASSANAFNEPSTFTDPLADAAGCTRDLPFLQQLGINTIRAYSVDSSLNHDSCMNAFSAAGIYTIIDLALPLNGSIDRDSPAWSTNIQDQYLATVSAFSKYDNVLAYNVGNEVMLVNSTAPAPFVKAAARDIKAYLTSISSSALVGYAAIDGPADFLDPLANYLSCDPSGSNSGSSAIDLFGLNNYEWCGDAPSTTYDGVNSEFAGYNVAAYFSEFGSETCNPGVRVWTETGTLFASPMTDIWSGGLAFSYFPASSSAGQFGMINISSDGTTVTPNEDFNNLVTQYSKISFVNSPSQSSATASSFPACPTLNSSWAASNSLPPTPNDAACLCLEDAMSCQFHTSSSNFSALVGTLIDTACSLLGSSGGTCDDIGSSGTTGVYGRVSMCDPVTKLSYVFSQYFELNGRQASACSFDGNGTVNANAPSETAVAAATSCIPSPSAVFTPSLSATATGQSGSSSGSSDSGSGSSGSASGAVSMIGGNVLFSVGLMAGFTVASAVWTLS